MNEQKVYIVTLENSFVERWENLGVFSSIKEAENYQEYKANKHGYSILGKSIGRDSQYVLDIEEWIIGEMINGKWEREMWKGDNNE